MMSFMLKTSISNMSMIALDLGSIQVQIIQKNIRNLHLSVYPPDGAVRVSAPEYMSLEAIRVYLIAKMPWIKQQQRKFQQQERESTRLYLPQESHYVWGERYLLRLVETSEKSHIDYQHPYLTLYHHTQSSVANRDELMAAWYRQLLREQAMQMIEKWQGVLGVQVKALYISKMKTRWGSCSPERGNIRLNSELAKKPKTCVEYIVLHELLHFIEPTHGERFVQLMNNYMNDWQHRRILLNELPIHG